MGLLDCTGDIVRRYLFQSAEEIFTYLAAMAFGDLTTEEGLQALNSFLADRSYIEGYAPSQALLAKPLVLHTRMLCAGTITSCPWIWARMLLTQSQQQLPLMMMMGLTCLPTVMKRMMKRLPRSRRPVWLPTKRKRAKRLPSLPSPLSSLT